MVRPLEAKKLILATHNKGKLVEFAAMFEPFDIEVISAGDLNLPEPEETGTTFVENALIKARAASKATGEVALADDSGLAVKALKGDPGVYSARWAGESKDFQAAMKKINDLLGENQDRSAAFVAVLSLCWPDGETASFEGRCEGRLIWPPRGDLGFGYDPMFCPIGNHQTFAENPSLKTGLSHRAIAFQKLIDHCL